MTVLAWECLAKGFCCGRWGEADAAAAAARAAAVASGALAPLEPTGPTAELWRNDRLVAAYCTPANLARRRRAKELALRLGLTAGQVALRYVVSAGGAASVSVADGAAGGCVVLPVVGTTTMEHLEANIAGVRGQALSADEVRFLEGGEEE